MFIVFVFISCSNEKVIDITYYENGKVETMEIEVDSQNTIVKNYYKSGDIQGAEDLFDLYLPMVRYEQQLGIGLAIRKEILRRRGILSSAKVRSPGPSLTEKDHAELTYLMERLRRKLEGFN